MPDQTYADSQMPLIASPEPSGLSKAVAKRYGRAKAILLRGDAIEYSSEVRPLWNGTVYTYKLSGKIWPTKVYVFEMRKADGSRGWQAYPNIPKRPTPLDAVKEALRTQWSEEMLLQR